MSEIFPLLSGLVVGVLLGLLRPQLRWPVGLVGAIALGTLATIFSGEYEIGWEFLLIDIPLVGIASAVGLFGTRLLMRRGSRRPGV